MKIKKIKLNALPTEMLQLKEMNAIVGGNFCSCSCYWANKGGASVNDNNMANYNHNYDSVHGCNQFTYDDEFGGRWWPEATHA